MDTLYSECVRLRWGGGQVNVSIGYQDDTRVIAFPVAGSSSQSLAASVPAPPRQSWLGNWLRCSNKRNVIIESSTSLLQSSHNCSRNVLQKCDFLCTFALHKSIFSSMDIDQFMFCEMWSIIWSVFRAAVWRVSAGGWTHDDMFPEMSIIGADTALHGDTGARSAGLLSDRGKNRTHVQHSCFLRTTIKNTWSSELCKKQHYCSKVRPEN